MGFIIKNTAPGSPQPDVEITDLGLTVPGGGQLDLITEQPNDVAMSGTATTGSLWAAITAGTIQVLDPLDDTTPLSTADAIEMVQVHNDPHFRIRGGTLNQLDDVDLDAVGSPIVLTNQVLQWNGTNAFEPITPDDLIGDGSDAVLDILAGALVNGQDTTVVLGGGSPFTTIQIDVDDSFLRNDGDTLDSGTLTIANGAALNVSGAGAGSPGFGGSITIGQDATATIETPTSGFTGDTDIVNKAYVDSVAAGLDPKESVRAATEPGDTAGTYTAASPCGPGDTITGFPGIIDTVVLAVDDRVLVKDRTLPAENGIYVVTTVNAVSPVTVDLVRAQDQDGNPEGEISSGNFTHVEQGTQNINTKWVVTGDGTLSPCVDDINWVLFSGPDTIIADVGLTRVANTISLDVGDLVSGTPVLTDTIAFHDADGSAQGVAGSQTYSRSFGEIFQDFDVIYGISTTGIIVNTGGSPQYEAREIQVNGLGNLDGLVVANGDGIAGDPTIGLDIQNLPAITSGSPSTIDSSDRVAVYDVSGDENVYYTVGQIAGALAATNSFETWAGGGNTSGDAAIVADSSTDTATLAGGVGINVVVAAASDTLTIDLTFDSITAAGSPLGVDTSDEIIINNGGTVEKITLGDLINQLGLSTTDEQIKVSANDTTAGYLNGKLVAGTYTTLTENNDGGNETLTVDIDPSQITLADLGDVDLTGSPELQDGDILIYDGTSSPQGWTYVPSSSLTFDVCTLTPGTPATLDLSDEIAVCDGGSTVKFSFSDILNTLDVPSGISGTGIVVKIEGSPDTYATRDIVESTTAGQEGAQVNNGDGVSGDIEIGVDINNLGDSADDMSATDEFITYDGTNNVSMSGQQIADGVADILNLPDLQVEIINGQPVVTYTDGTRGGSPGGKRLSTDMVTYSWEENQVGNNDWIRLGGATDALTGHIMPLNATIVGIVAHTSNDNGNSKGIRLYIDGTPFATDPLFSFTAVSGENSYNSFVSMNLDIDVDQGEKIRLRGAATGGAIEDTVITLYIRWRS